jgi:16S rRNA (uracil1498-N3)-methyltransferase
VTANQFFVPALPEGAARVVVEGAEHRHLARAARVRPGETVRLFDGSGRRALARVAAVGEERTELDVVRTESPEAPRTAIALAPGLVEARTFETILEKAAEIGCASVWPVETERSLRTPGERSARKLERWRRIVREAAKQCKSPLLTEVHPPRPLAGLLREPPPGRRLFLSERGGRPLRDVVAEAGGPPRAAVLLVGPTGGWSEAEEREAREAGFEAVSLGSRILKSGTAALAGAFLLAHHWNG